MAKRNTSRKSLAFVDKLNKTISSGDVKGLNGAENLTDQIVDQLMATDLTKTRYNVKHLFASKSLGTYTSVLSLGL